MLRGSTQKFAGVFVFFWQTKTYCMACCLMQHMRVGNAKWTKCWWQWESEAKKKKYTHKFQKNETYTTGTMRWNYEKWWKITTVLSNETKINTDFSLFFSFLRIFCRSNCWIPYIGFRNFHVFVDFFPFSLENPSLFIQILITSWSLLRLIFEFFFFLLLNVWLISFCQRQKWEKRNKAFSANIRTYLSSNINKINSKKINNHGRSSSHPKQNFLFLLHIFDLLNLSKLP